MATHSTCGLTEASCTCNRPMGHKGAHVCPAPCLGSWTFDAEGNFAVVALPGQNDALSFTAEATYDAQSRHTPTHPLIEEERRAAERTYTVVTGDGEFQVTTEPGFFVDYAGGIAFLDGEGKLLHWFRDAISVHRSEKEDPS